jgi:hydrogenase expression/formation protein HypD
MKYVDEFRDATAARRQADAIARLTTRPWTIMEICGGQTHSIVRHGIDRMLPDGVTLLHGPGCPVCVTPAGLIDAAVAIAERPGVIFCSFGDMLRVPGRSRSLLAAKAGGADIRMVYSPLDAVAIARAQTDREIVFFAVGFETTAPATAMAVLQAEREGLGNFSLLVSHVLVPPAIEALLNDPHNGVHGFLAAGHVCTVMGYWQYEPIARRYRVPIVVTGFEPLDLLQGLHLCIRQLEEGRAEVENQYSRAVRRDGNRTAQDVLARVFAVQPQTWRGLGEIPASGLGLAPEYARYNALRRFADIVVPRDRAGECVSGEILRGLKKPGDCPAFGTRCTPEHPLGATMVSSEGACAAYYRYRRPRAGPAAAFAASERSS